MPAAYTEGSVVRVQVTFKNAAGTLTNPGVVSLKVRNPADVVTTFTLALGGVTNLSLGIFFRDVTVDKAGAWEFWYAGSSGVTATAGEEIIVTAARVI